MKVSGLQLLEKAVRDLYAVVAIDADWVSIEGGVMNPGKRQSGRHEMRAAFNALFSGNSESEQRRV